MGKWPLRRFVQGGARPFYPNGEVVGGNLSDTDVFDVAYEPNGSFLYVATNSSSAVGDQVSGILQATEEMVLDRGCKFSLGTTNLNPNITDFELAVSPQCKRGCSVVGRFTSGHF